MEIEKKTIKKIERKAIYNQADISRLYYPVKSDWVKTYDYDYGEYNVDYIIENNAYDYIAINKKISKMHSGWDLYYLDKKAFISDENYEVLYTRAEALTLLFLLVEPSKKGTAISKIISNKSNELTDDEKKNMIDRLEMFLRDGEWKTNGKWYMAMQELCHCEPDEPLTIEEINTVVYNYSQVLFYQTKFDKFKENIYKQVDDKISQLFEGRERFQSYLFDWDNYVSGTFSELSLGEISDIIEHLEEEYTKMVNKLFDPWILNFEYLYQEEGHSVKKIIEEIYKIKN